VAESNAPKSDKTGSWRFILLFLLINILIFVLIWLMQQNWELIQQNRDMRTIVAEAETRMVGLVTTCEVDCTDKMVTVAARLGTEVARLTATIGASIPVPPTPTGLASITPSPTPTTLPTPTSTPIPVPTGTSTPSPTPAATETPTVEPKPPDETPSPPQPTVLGITPISMTRVPDSIGWLTVVITGYDFVATPPPTVRLRNVQAAVLMATAETITAMVPYTMPSGVYGLTVTNYGGEPSAPPRFFTVYEPDPPDPFYYTTLESSYLVTFGGQTGWSLGDDDQVQLLFVGVPDSLTDSLHLRIFDPDAGGQNCGDEIIGSPDTTITYTLYGLTHTYTLPEARAAHPTTGITSGTALVTNTMAVTNTWDGDWYLLHSFSPVDGELVDGRRVFKLAVEGAKEGDDGNLYNVVMSSSPDTNTVLSGVRLFAFSWTWLVHDRGGQRYRPHLYLYVPEGTAKVQPYFFPGPLPFQNGNGCVQICTPLDCLPATQTEYLVGSGEAGATWTIDMSNCELQDPYRRYAITFWAEDQGGVALPIFSRPTIVPPP